MHWKEITNHKLRTVHCANCYIISIHLPELLINCLLSLCVCIICTYVKWHAKTQNRTSCRVGRVGKSVFKIF